MSGQGLKYLLHMLRVTKLVIIGPFFNHMLSITIYCFQITDHFQQNKNDH